MKTVPPITRRDLLRGTALSAVMLGTTNWSALLDEKPALTAADLQVGAHPFVWTPPQALASADPALVLLSRLAFGPRPGDLARVKSMGLDAWMEQQLSPASIPDAATDDLLKNFPTLGMAASELFQVYPQAKAGKKTSTGVAEAVQGFVSLFEGNAAAAPNNSGPAEVILELSQAALLRAIFSERQLLEVMVDFWTNHFNIYILKESDKWIKTVDDREVIRQYALGKFRDLLSASSHSPAMLVYLDNVNNKKGVAQENYAREILELHTLGVNGGYTQTDVQELARVLTGWTVRPAKKGALGGPDYTDAGTFVFNPQFHDIGDKIVLGLRLQNNGVREGEQVIEMLAKHPSTAKFIAAKLARRFVSDSPSDALVASLADTFSKTDGDIRQVLRALLHSDEFKQSFGSKIKRPFEFVASAARVLNPTLTLAKVKAGVLRAQAAKGLKPNQPLGEPLILALRTMGQLPFQWPTPDGFPDTASAWVNTNNMLQRWNLALAVVANQVPGLQFDLAAQMQDAKAGTPEQVVDFWVDRILNRSIPDPDRAALINHMHGDMSQSQIRDVVALILASPHFQYR